MADANPSELDNDAPAPPAPIVEETGTITESATAAPVRVVHRSAWRPVVESIAVLVIGVILFRTFAAEAYIVPTGSMAPTLLGIHREIVCTDCLHRFAMGEDEDGRAGRPICPNCGANLAGAPTTHRNGDRLLVQKHFYDWRPPRRWEVVVFQNPAEAGQAFVKRVVGLPGESIEIRNGDIYIDDQLARKNLSEQRAMRILVHDNAHRPSEASWFPRWRVRSGGQQTNNGHWLPQGGGFSYQPIAVTDEADRDAVAWLEYRHQEPGRGGFGALRDFTPYNGAEVSAEHRVADVMLQAEVVASPGVKSLHVALRHGSDRYEVTLPVGAGAVEGPLVERNDIPLPSPVGVDHKALAKLGQGRSLTLEASLFDRRILVAIDGRLLFEPIDDPPGNGPPPGPSHSPIALGVIGGPAEIRSLKIYRDVYYTEGLAYAPARPFGVGQPYRLGPGEYFVLGDNSPVSNDSRFWPEGPVVRTDLLLGKPFLVHLPSRGVPLRVFGDEMYWVPDLREIRYIR